MTEYRPCRRAEHTVIIGGGLAGLFTALKLAPLPVTVIAGGPLGEAAASVLAQGGIAAAVGPGDTVEAHAADTIAAGAGLVDEAMAHLLAAEGPARITDLLEYGVPFDKDLKGRLQLSREAAHSARRVVKVDGDMAGAMIMEALIRSARAAPHITLREDALAEEIIMDRGRAVAVALRVFGAPVNAPLEVMPAAAIVMATGGAGGLYAFTSNPRGAVGSGLAMAARAGAVIADAEFVQFHPTAIDAGLDPAPLATEALRGEGAWLINRAGERFMTTVHKDAELAPRDIVARAVFDEVTAGRGAFLDCRKAIGDEFESRFPQVYRLCRKAGIDPAHDPIPVAPAAHYHMGGVLTDANGRTTIDGLWACGEVTSTGVHGANRLASNSLLEAAVFGARIAEDISEHCPLSLIMVRDEVLRARRQRLISASSQAREIARLRQLMTRHVGVVRHREGLATALAHITALEADTPPSKLATMATTALFITAAAYARLESRGGHFRSDYPQENEALRVRSMLTLEKARAIAASALTRAARPRLAVVSP